MAERYENPIALSEKERLILSEVAKGRTTPQIAALIKLSPETVKWYRKRLLEKFSASTSSEMIMKAVERHFL